VLAESSHDVAGDDVPVNALATGFGEVAQRQSDA
jgi:hypothetical protein